MDLESSAIADLADQINAAIGSVSNVEQILSDTSDDLNTAQDLKVRADRTRENAEAQLKHAEEVTTNLSEAVEAQNKADVSIQSAQADIDVARKDLSQVRMIEVKVWPGFYLRRYDERSRDYHQSCCCCCAC